MHSPKFFATPGFGERLLSVAHYAQAVRVGGFVETAGHGGWDDSWTFPETIEAEITQAFDNLERTLDSAGASWRHVIKVNSFHLGAEHGRFPSEHIALMTRELRRRMGARAPIWTAVGAPALGDPNMRVEIQLTAFVDEVTDDQR